MADRTVELAQALYDALRTSSDVYSIVGTGGVRAHVSPGARPPYVAIGEGTAVDVGGSEVDSQEHVLVVHCWSEAPSPLEVKQLMAAVRDTLHDADLTMPAGQCPNIRCEYQETLRDPDGVTYHGVMRFRAVTQD